MKEALNELALFAGAGGGILGGKILGWRTVCAVEIDPYCASVLMQRQNDKILPPFPIWDDIRTFDGTLWRGIVDVVSGGFPCQDISCAGKGKGIDGERSGLWKEMARIISEVQPRYTFVENSPMLTNRGLGLVLGDLAEMGYDAEWGVLGAVDAGAPHKRDRIWVVAYSYCARLEGRDSQFMQECTRKIALGKSRSLENANSAKLPRFWSEPNRQSHGSANSSWWETEPDVGRVADGVAFRVDRLKALGNGQVPAVAKLAWETLTGEMNI